MCLGILVRTVVNINQGWKSPTVPTGKNRAGQVKVLYSFPKERLKFWKLLSVCMPWTGENNVGQVIVLILFRGKNEIFCNFHPDQCLTKIPILSRPTLRIY